MKSSRILIAGIPGLSQKTIQFCCQKPSRFLSETFQGSHQKFFQRSHQLFSSLSRILNSFLPVYQEYHLIGILSKFSSESSLDTYQNHLKVLRILSNFSPESSRDSYQNLLEILNRILPKLPAESSQSSLQNSFRVCFFFFPLYWEQGKPH